MPVRPPSSLPANAVPPTAPYAASKCPCHESNRPHSRTPKGPYQPPRALELPCVPFVTHPAFLAFLPTMSFAESRRPSPLSPYSRLKDSQSSASNLSTGCALLVLPRLCSRTYGHPPKLARPFLPRPHADRYRKRSPPTSLALTPSTLAHQSFPY